MEIKASKQRNENLMNIRKWRNHLQWRNQGVYREYGENSGRQNDNVLWFHICFIYCVTNMYLHHK